MQNLLRSWVGAGRPFSVKQASVVIKRKHQFTRERRVRQLRDNPEKMQLHEFIAFAQMFGPKFTNEVLDYAGQTGVISIKGWVSEEKVGEAMAKWHWEYFNQPGNGNGKNRKLRRALVRVIRMARAHLSRPKHA